MPKTVKRSLFTYSEDAMKKAVEAVRNGMTKREAAKTFQVPRATLIRKVNNIVPEERKMGPSTVLTNAEEDLLEKWILGLARKGFPITRHMLCISVKKTLDRNGRPNPFKENMPGITWFRAFLRRHPMVSEKHTESLTKAHAAVTKEGIQNWFHQVDEILTQDGFREVLSHPECIFNADETGFMLCPKTGKVLGPRTRGDLYHEVPNNEKEQITVMGCFSANGETVPPMVIFPYKRMPKEIADSVPNTWAIGLSEKGWINSELFFEYITNHFNLYLDDQKIKRPVILFVDGHRSHLTPEVSDFCSDNGIVLIALHPNSTHLLQPADVSVFKPLKDGWKDAVRQWKFANYPQEVTRKTFSPLLHEVFAVKATPQTIINGFKATGLYPFTPENVNYDKCIKSRDIINPLTNPASADEALQQDFLKVLESKIHPDTLISFKSVKDGEQWDGTEASKDLFYVWRSFKSETASESNVYDSLFTFEAAVDGGDITCATPSTTTLSPIATSTPSTSRAYPPKKEGQISSPFKSCLFWPKTPEKKNTRRQRMVFPAVVSSEKWKTYFEAQKKETKKTSKKKVKTDKDWICNKCKGSFNDEKKKKLKRTWVECDKCYDTYHFKCIPKSHLEEFGLEEDMEEDVLFYCCNCKILDDEEDNYEMHNLDNES